MSPRHRSARRPRGVMSALVGLGLLTAGAAGWLLWPPVAQRRAPEARVADEHDRARDVPDVLARWPAGRVCMATRRAGQLRYLRQARRPGMTSDASRLIHPTTPLRAGRLTAARSPSCEQGSQGNTIHLVSPIGGGERKLSDFPAGGLIAWSPDGRYLATGRIDRPGSAGPRLPYLLVAGRRRRTSPHHAPGHCLCTRVFTRRPTIGVRVVQGCRNRDRLHTESSRSRHHVHSDRGPSPPDAPGTVHDLGNYLDSRRKVSHLRGAGRWRRIVVARPR